MSLNSPLAPSLPFSDRALAVLKEAVRISREIGSPEVSVWTEAGESRFMGIPSMLTFHRRELDELTGYLTPGPDNGLSSSWTVTNAAIELVDSYVGAPTLVAERQMSIGLDRARARSPKVADSLEQAFALALTAATQEQISDVGHRCRIAYQDAVDQVYRDANLTEVKGLKKTKNRIAHLIEHRNVTETDREALRNLAALFDAPHGLFERAEHRSENDNRPLISEDAVEVVLLTHLAVSQVFRWF